VLGEEYENWDCWKLGNTVSVAGGVWWEHSVQKHGPR